jgi:hypothetical protein
MKWLGIEESKHNPKATGWSVLKKAIKCGLGGAVMSQSPMLSGHPFDLGFLVLFVFFGLLVGAVWEWQEGDENFDEGSPGDLGSEESPKDD